MSEIKHYRELHSGLADMIVSGRLQPTDIPEDYDWLVKTLAKTNLSASESVATKAHDGAHEWTEHPDFPRLDWQREVANGYTRLGYSEWCLHQAEVAQLSP